MKSFKEIRKSKGSSVYKKKHGKYPVEIKKEGSKYVAYIDGDKLDSYRSERDAKKGIDMMLKEL
jgi:uncharacterized protein YegP (UPF0339 family)